MGWCNNDLLVKKKSYKLQTIYNGLFSFKCSFRDKNKKKNDIYLYKCAYFDRRTPKFSRVNDQTHNY